MASRQTKTTLDADQLETLRRGAERFNRGLFFEAHEDWETRWRRLPQPDQARVQAAILVCGVFVLLGKGRVEPAARLARLAIDRFAGAAATAELHALRPSLDLPGAEDRLLRVLARIQVGEKDPAALLTESRGLSASVVGHP